MLKIRGAALVAATALVMSGVAACGDEGEPAESSSTASPSAVEPSSSSESSGSGSSSAPSESSGAEGDGEVVELPAAAKEQTKEGAIAFNEFYQEQTGEALHSGQAATLEEYSQDCRVCDGMVKRVREYAAKDITMNKNPNKVQDPKASKRADGGYRVELTVAASSYHQVLSDGSAGPTADAVTFTVVTDTQWTNGHWVIRDQVRTK